ncbi:hypothetical protein ACFORG_13430, partial [Lutimaribacter marinistellae]
LSVRQAADRLGVSPQTAARAFQHLQEKGFIVVTEIGHPGVHGCASGHRYEITELPLPQARDGRHLYRAWRKGEDFEVLKAKAHNPSGRNGQTRSRSDNSSSDVTLSMTKKPEMS